MISKSLKNYLACFRAVRLVLHLLYGALLATIYPHLSRGLQKSIMRQWSIDLLNVLNVRISVSGDISLHDIKQGLIVANHISWLDVYVMSSILPMRFVAKSEVRNWPFIGWLCSRAQTIFIERNKKSDTVRTNLQMVEHLRQGNAMAIFPEGTTSNGTQVRHFHASLLQPAIDAQTPIYPVGIHYHDKHNKPNFDAAYIDDMSFMQSLWKILSSRDLHVRLTTAHELSTEVENRRLLALEAHRRIAHALSIELPPVVEEPKPSPQHSSEDDQQHFQSSYSLLLYPAINHEPHEIQ
jgi:1-acyl-sn-glycerol-3-phosphate acyltransferase